MKDDSMKCLVARLFWENQIESRMAAQKTPAGIRTSGDASQL